ncbi:AraC family transcriptional regulator [Paenibacillus contaminans]|nr:AraC family transcriptional regulator [Paenibacillus contaminans]
MLHIMIASSEMSVREAVGQMARAFGHAIVGEAEDAENARMEIDKGWPAVLITDTGSSNLDGMSLLRHIDEQNLPIAAIAVGDCSDPELIRQAMRHGAVDFLPKPINGNELAYALRLAARRLEYVRSSMRLFQRVEKFFADLNGRSPADIMREQADIVRAMRDPQEGRRGAGLGMLRMFARKWHEWFERNGYPYEPCFRRRSDEGVDAYFQRLAELWIARSAALADNNGKLVIKMACGYIQENYGKSFTLTEISERFGMSVSYFSAQFKRTTGYSFIEYVNSVRIRKAKELLLRPNVMIYEVAHEVGFATVQYFNKSFKSAVRMTPNEFRKKLGVY